MSSEHMHEVYVILILQNIRVIHSIEAAYLCFVSGMFSLLHYFLVYHPSFPCLLSILVIFHNSICFLLKASN